MVIVDKSQIRMDFYEREGVIVDVLEKDGYTLWVRVGVLERDGILSFICDFERERYMVIVVAS